MPIAVALDYCQNVTGERDDAVTALLGAAANWLDTQTVPGGATLIDSGCIDDRDSIAGYIRSEGLGMAAIFLSHIRSRCDSAAHPIATGAERFAAAQWQAWANKAAFAIALCRTVIDAAYPVETSTGDARG